jgi:hypothetical protein
MYRWATSAVGGGEGGDHAQGARAQKGRGNKGGKQHVVLLNTENAGRGDARGGGTELAGSECHSIHGVWGPEAWGG